MLKHGDTFAVFDHYGDIVARPRAAPRGSITRTPAILSSFQLRSTASGRCCSSSTVQDDNALLDGGSHQPRLSSTRRQAASAARHASTSRARSSCGRARATSACGCAISTTRRHAVAARPSLRRRFRRHLRGPRHAARARGGTSRRSAAAAGVVVSPTAGSTATSARTALEFDAGARSDLPATAARVRPDASSPGERRSLFVTDRAATRADRDEPRAAASSTGMRAARRALADGTPAARPRS